MRQAAPPRPAHCSVALQGGEIKTEGLQGVCGAVRRGWSAQCENVLCDCPGVPSCKVDRKHFPLYNLNTMHYFGSAVKCLTVFYLQMRDFHESLSLNHLVKSLLLNCTDNGLSVNIIGYKQKNSPEEGAIPLSGDAAHAKILDRRYQKKSSFLSRYIYECWLVIRAGFHPKLWKASDVCLAYSFPSTFLYIWMAKAIFRKKAIFWIQDLWPENAVEAGVLRRGSIPYKVFSLLEKRAYRQADVIVPISEDIANRLTEYGIPESKINVIHNWGYDDTTPSVSWKENCFVKYANLCEDTFHAVYAGNIGAVQNVELVVESAALLKQRTDIRFLIVGDGVALNAIIEKAEGLKNVSFFPMQPPSMARHIYCAASVNLIPLRKGIVFTALPSKTAILLACGRPVIASLDIDSHYASLLQKYGVGPITDPKDARALADAVASIADSADTNYTEENVRKCFEEQFSQKTAFERFDKIFKTMGRGQSSHVQR